MTNRRKSTLYALFSVLLWSTAATAFKIALKDSSPVELLAYSSFVSFLVLLTISIATKSNFKLSKASLGRSAFLGALNPFLYYLVLFKAYDILPAQEALALNYSWAVMTPLLAIPILKQKMTLINLTALLVSFCGAALVALKGNFNSLHLSNAQGSILALSSSLVWALYWVLNAKDERDALPKLTLNFFFGAIYCIAYAIITGALTLKAPDELIPLAYIGLFEMGITFFLWLNALKFASKASSAASLIFLSPFISLFLINYALEEKVVANTIVGLALIIIGISLNNIRVKPNNVKSGFISKKKLDAA